MADMATIMALIKAKGGGGGGGGGDVTDVQVNGTSVVNSSGVAAIPIAPISNDGIYGLVKINNSANGITIDPNDGYLRINPANSTQIKNGGGSYSPIAPGRLNEAIYYGLANLAGASMASLTRLTLGTYPEAQKSAISQMLNAPETVSGSTPTIAANAGVRYVCGECSTLTIEAPASGIIDVVFESGSTPTVLTVTPPTGLTMKWANGFDPTALEADTVYEIKIMDGYLGNVHSWS